MTNGILMNKVYLKYHKRRYKKTERGDVLSRRTNVKLDKLDSKCDNTRAYRLVSYV